MFTEKLNDTDKVTEYPRTKKVIDDNRVLTYDFLHGEI